jgi:hypothetical protein
VKRRLNVPKQFALIDCTTAARREGKEKKRKKRKKYIKNYKKYKSENGIERTRAVCFDRLYKSCQ